MQNIVEFHIIGRLGRIDAAKNVTHISVATNYNRREGETWKSDPQWHRVTLFAKRLCCITSREPDRPFT